jgi:hypothetical protein
LTSVNDLTPDSESNRSSSSDQPTPPAIEVTDFNLCGDIMKCLNLLGILWNARGNAKRFDIISTLIHRTIMKH